MKINPKLEPWLKRLHPKLQVKVRRRMEHFNFKGQEWYATMVDQQFEELLGFIDDRKKGWRRWFDWLEYWDIYYRLKSFLKRKLRFEGN